MSDPVVIDGNLQEVAWQQAAIISCFSPNEGNHTNYSATQLRLWYNDAALFLGWHCHDENIQATLRNRDDHLWNEDVVEFFVTPNELSRYFEFQWSPSGTIFDAVVTNRCNELGVSMGYQFEPTFTATHLKSGVTTKGSIELPGGTFSGWQIEVMIPFADLSQPTPKPHDVWRANFFRINRGTNQIAELSSWSPTLSPRLHQPNRFGSVEFGQ